MPVFLPRESHGQRSLAGYSPWGCIELDTTEALQFSAEVSASSQQMREERRRMILQNVSWVRPAGGVPDFCTHSMV